MLNVFSVFQYLSERLLKCSMVLLIWILRICLHLDVTAENGLVQYLAHKIKSTYF